MNPRDVQREYARGVVPKEVVTLQYLRGVAAMMVVIHHLYSGGLEYLYIPQWGGFGVDIFFVISGFIMWHTTVSARMSLVGFWRRRIVRIVPLYWVCTGALAVIAVVLPQDLKSTVVTPGTVVMSLLFVPHFNEAIKVIAPILFPGWSLNYEMFFYVVFGLGLLVRGASARAALVSGALVALVVVGVVVKPSGAIAETYTSTELLKFVWGIGLAIVYRAGWLPGRNIGILAIVAGGVLYAFCAGYGLADFIGLSPTLIVAGALSLEDDARRAPVGLLHTIGDASYSIYLTHLFFIRACEIATRKVVQFGVSAPIDVLYVALCFCFAIGGGVVVYYAVERPILGGFRKAVA